MTAIAPTRQEPIPVLALLRAPASERALGALREDPRVEVILADDRRTTWVSCAQRAAAVVVVTNADPLSAFLYVVTAGVTRPVVVAAPRRFAPDRRIVLRAGAVACCATPLTRTDVGRLVRLAGPSTGGMRADGALHLVLDPIGRLVRLQARSVRLSQREFAILHFLSTRHGRPVSANDILRYVWGDARGRQKTREILEVYIFALRRKLRRLGLRNAIHTVRGYGYALAPAPADR